MDSRHNDGMIQRIGILVGGSIMGLLAFGLGARSQSDQNGPQVRTTKSEGFLVLESNGLPDHATGAFPNPGNPNRIAPRNHRFRIPMKPSPARGEARGVLFGVAVNGIPFDPGTAELWNGDFRWHYEALSGALSVGNRLGVDRNLAHVQPDGTYHYHGIPKGLVERLGADKRMVRIGWAADGYPVYSNFGPKHAGDLDSPMTRLSSSWRLRTGKRPGGDGPGGTYDGSFQQDFEYVEGSGDLDRFNGRFGPTPEYPKGTYYYVLTDTFPFVPRQFKGEPDVSFRKGPGPSGGPGGPPRRFPNFAGNGRSLYLLEGDWLIEIDPRTRKEVRRARVPGPDPR